MIETVAELIRLVDSDEPDERRGSACGVASPDAWKALGRTIPRCASGLPTTALYLKTYCGFLRLILNGECATSRQQRSCPSGILELLSRDAHDSIALTVAGHSNTPNSALRGLRNIRGSRVLQKAIRHLPERGELPRAQDGN
jgi:hypothetical protein